MKKLFFLFLIFVLKINFVISQPVDLSINEIAQTSDAIFVGTVEKISCRWNEKRTMIFTDVFFRSIEWVHFSENAKQKNAKTFSLTYAGGKLDGKNISVSEMPHFEVDKRYLIFTFDNEKVYSNPILGNFQGKFEVIKDSVTGKEYVIDVSKKIITGYDGNKWSFSKNSVKKIANNQFEYQNDTLILRNQSLPVSSDSKDQVFESKNLKKDSLSPMEKSQVIEIIQKKILKTPLKEKKLRLDGQGFYYFRNKNNELECFAIKSLFTKEKSSFFQVKKSDIKHGSLGMCGSHSLNIVMKQVPSSFSEFGVYNNIMYDMNLVMDIFSYIDSDGSFAGNNGVNEFCNSVSNEALNSQYGFQWGGALGMTITYAEADCGPIAESDHMYNPSYSWSENIDDVINGSNIYNLVQVSMHELGHVCGFMLGPYSETYAYDQLSIMHGGYQNIYENGRLLHAADAYLLRQHYKSQTAIKSYVDVGIESYYADPDVSQFNLRPSTTDKAVYEPDEVISISNVTAENNSNVSLSDVRVQFFLSRNRDIPANDYELGSYLYFDNFNAESRSRFGANRFIPWNVPAGEYFVGIAIYKNQFTFDDHWRNNTTTLTSKISITPKLSLANSQMYFSHSVGSSSLGFASNTYWAVSCAESWVNFDVRSGEMSSTIYVSVGENNSRQDRSATIKVHYGNSGEMKNVYLTQSGIPVSVENQEIAEKKVQPNPNNGQFFIEFEKEQFVEVKILNLNGQNVYSGKMSVKKGKQNFDFSHLTRGIYFLQLISNEKTATQKFVIE